MVRSPAQIIDDKGGPAAVAKALNLRPAVVRVWKHRDQFPRAHWPEIGGAFADLDTETLLAAERVAEEQKAA